MILDQAFPAVESRHPRGIFGELLDPSSTNVELFSDQFGVHVVVNNTLTDSGDIVLV